MNGQSLFRYVVSGLFVASSIIGAAACGPSGGRAAHQMRPIDEGRAVKLIAQALADDGLVATPPRTVMLRNNTEVTLDVGVADRKVGVIYLTANDLQKIPGHSAAAKNDSQDLHFEPGDGPDIGSRFVILVASDYTYDDNVGTDHEQTATTAENKLQRDVRDFVFIAKKNGW